MSDFGGDGPRAVIGEGKHQPTLRSGLAHLASAPRRLHSQFLGASETCHTADNLGVALTARCHDERFRTLLHQRQPYLSGTVRRWPPACRCLQEIHGHRP